MIAVVDLSSSGNSADIVAARSGYRVVVENYTLRALGTVQVKFTDTSNAEIIPEYSEVDTSGISSPHNPDGLFETPNSKGLRMNLNASVQVSGHINYHYRYTGV